MRAVLLLLVGLFWSGVASAGPKNIFVFIADGAGYNTFAATSMYQGRWDGRRQAGTGQVYGGRQWVQVGKASSSLAARAGAAADPARAYDSRRAWRSDAARWHVETHPDSAATMTQMMTGVKTYNGAINVGLDGQPLVSFVELAAAAARGIGVVTSVPLSHATPASAAGAHSASRRDYAAISQEIFEADVVDVWMGGGHPVYDDDGAPRAELAFQYLSEQTWASAYAQQGGWDYLDRVEEFAALAAGGAATAPRVLGLAPVAATLQTDRSGARPEAVPGEVPLLQVVPTLHTMAQGALRHLSATHPDGFFLMVEGGAVDWAMHGNAAGHMIEEMVAFNEAVEGVVAWIEESGGGWEDNLVIITADHDHLFQGIPTRRDPLPPVRDRGAGTVPEHTWLSDDHSNHLVPVFARGPGAEALAELADERDRRRGPYIQDTEIFDVLLAAWALEDPR